MRTTSIDRNVAGIQASVEATVRRRPDLNANYVNVFDVPTELFGELPGQLATLRDGTRTKHLYIERTDITFFEGSA